MKKIVLIIVTVLFTSLVYGGEHSVVKGLKGFSIEKEKVEDYGELKFSYKENGKREEKNVGGKYYYYKYISDDVAEKISTTNTIKNFKDEVTKSMKGTVLRETSTSIDFLITLNSGMKYWCKVSASNSGRIKTIYRLEIIEEGSNSKLLTLGEEEIRAAIEKEGKVSLYGILFDSGSAILKESSNEELRALLGLMKNDEEIKIEIQGHTDSDGDEAVNMKLSSARAEQVKKYLELFGIEKNRLIAKGYGESKPISDNDSADGKAKNRRVEIVKIK